MKSSTKLLLAVATMSSAVACGDLIGTRDTDVVLLSPAFQSMPAAYSAASNSFDPSGDVGEAFLPVGMAPVGFREGGGPDGNQGGAPGPKHERHGFGEGGLRGLLMGGGLGPDYIGYILFGKGKGRGPFGWYKLPDQCVFSLETGRVTCPDMTKHGLTVRVSYAFADADGDPQERFDTLTTDVVNVRTAVSGTKTHREGAATTTVDHESDRTIAGLAPGSTERTVSGSAEAEEVTEGVRDGIAFTARRELNDTTRSLVIPIVDGRPTIPSSGLVIRNMKVTITKAGEVARTKSRREKITFDGTNVLQIEITQDDVTKSCTLTLPGKNLVCN